MENSPSNWICRNDIKPDIKLSREINCSPVLLEILAKRNITGADKIVSFLKPSLKNLRDPMKLPGINKGIKRIKEAITKKENIIIFGDYDADGIISAYLMYRFLNDLGLSAEVYIPDRFEEGYDLSVDFLKRISDKNKYNLVISVDCGTNSSEVQDFIRDNHCMDVIVCDHHNQSINSDSIPEGYIIINPKLKNSRYKFKHLSGAAVTFKFITAVLRNLDDENKNKFKKDYLTGLLDLVAISTIADIMPLVDENRIMVKKGLKILQKTKNHGIKKMIGSVLGGKKCVDEYDIGFIITPRLNAAGRIKNARIGFDLLAGQGNVLDKIIYELNSFNKNRQEIQKEILNEIIKNNDFKKIISNKKIFIGKSKNWSEGVLGIVASDIVKRFNIPAVLFREIEGKLKGSGRSTGMFDLYENLIQLKGLFDSFGGHRLACGISMDIKNYETFKKNVEKITYKKLKLSDIERKNFYDAEINFKDFSSGIFKEIELLRPFGYENPQPVFVTEKCSIVDFSYLSKDKHVRLKLKQSGIIVDAIAFEIDEKIKGKIIKNNKINILYRVLQNNRSDFNTAQIVILDLF